MKPGVAIGGRSGRAKTDYLRFEEVARQGAVLEARGSIELSGDAAADAALVCLALAATRLVERIGGNRRRGSGRCTMTIGDFEAQGADAGLPASVDDAVARIETLAAPTLPKPARPGALATEFAPGSDSEFTVVPLDVTVETPTVVGRAVLGNVVTTLDHIPGTMLVAAAARMLDPGGAHRQRVASGFASGDIRILPAYPVVARQRGLPVPLVYERLKDDDRGPRRKGLLRNRLDAECGGDEPYKTLHSEYIAYRGEAGKHPELAFFRQPLVTRTHNTVEDGHQTPTRRVGGVYSYEAIPAGTELKSELWIRNSLLDAIEIATLRAVDVTIGRAKKAGYGAVRVAPAGAPRPRATSAASAADGFRLYAASDILLPGEPVQGHAASPVACLCAAIRRAADFAIDVVDGEIWTGRTEGWVARWELPRPSYVVIRAGSTVAVKPADDGAPIAGDAIAKLERGGLGLRRGEGFGHVLVDPQIVKARLQDVVDLVVDAAAGQTHKPDLSPHVAFLAKIEDAALRQAIRLNAELAVVRPKDRETRLGWGGEKPNMSQLGALRAVMGGLQSDEEARRVREFIRQLRDEKNRDRAGKWGGEDASAGDHPLATLARLFDEPRGIWEKIGFTDDQWQLLLVLREPAQARASEELQRFAIASFLFAAMRAHKRSMEPADDERAEPHGAAAGT